MKPKKLEWIGEIEDVNDWIVCTIGDMYHKIYFDGEKFVASMCYDKDGVSATYCADTFEEVKKLAQQSFERFVNRKFIVYFEIENK